MIRKAIAFFSQELSGLHQAAFLLALSSFASALLALFRDRLFAHLFGAGRELDIYYAAFRIPDLLFVSIASFVSVTVLIPFIIERMQAGETKRAETFFNEVLTIFFAVMVVVCGAVALAMPTLSGTVAPGFDVEAREMYIVLSRILLLSPFLLGLSNLLGSITQSLHKFYIYALSPILYNAGIIFGALVLYPAMGLPGLVWGVVLGAFVHMSIQIPTIVHAGFRPRLTTRINYDDMRPVIRLSLPRTVGLGLNQVVIIVLIALGSYMKEGSISIFNFAYNLQSVPLSIIGVSYSVAAFPTLAKLVSKGLHEQFMYHVVNAIRYILFWSLPITGITIALRREIVSVFLGSGRFTAGDVQLTAAVVALFVVSVAAQGLLLLFTRSYYAAGQTRKPLFANMISSVVTIGLAFGLVRMFDVSASFRAFFESLLDMPAADKNIVLMLPLAFSLGMILNVYIHWRAFVIDFRPDRELLIRPLRQSLSVAILAGLAVFGIRIGIALVPALAALGGIVHLVIGALGGILTVLLAMHLFGSPELLEVRASLRARFSKAAVVAPEHQGL